MKRQILIGSLILLFTAGLATAETIHVPGAFPYIELSDAINNAQNGDVIIVAQGEYPGSGFTINRDIMVTSSNPDEPNVVAATIINCAGEEQIGFRLNGDGGTVVLNGFTIINAAPNAGTTIPPVPVPGVRGNANNGYGLTGGGVIINGNHIVSNCVIRNCTVTAGNASVALPSAVGDPDVQLPDPPVQPTHPGGHGGRGGTARGAGIAVIAGNPRIENTTIESCIVNGGNASVGQDGLAAVPDDSNYPGGPGGNGGDGGSVYGGGIYCAGGTPIFENCTVRSCQAFAANGADGGNGGADADITVTDPYGFSGWGQGGHSGVPGLAHGAGVYCDNGTTATFIDCNFIDNHAYGAFGGNGGNSDANDQTSYWRGGLGGLATVGFVNAAITAIIQRLPGGHPLQPGDFPPQSQGGVAIPAENYSANGGGVYIAHGATATFTGCTFRDNVTRGSVSGVGGTHTLLDTVILNDFTSAEQPRNPTRIPSFGGGVYCADTTTTFTDCNIQGNRTVEAAGPYVGNEYTGYGGGMCFAGGILGMGNFGYVELNNCHIADNNAPVGGGVCGSALTDFHVDDCNFVGNWAYLGAGLFSIDNYSTISRSNFIGNRAYDPNEDLYGSGSGLFSFSSDVLISDCIFSENTTSGFGAGIYMSGEVAIPPLTADPMLKNCLISNNQAGLDGGGIYCDWYAEPNIINCTIANNEARGDPPFGVGYGGGLYCSYESDVNIINSIVWGNAGPNTIGPELAVETWFGFAPTMLTVSYCDVEGGQEEVWVDDDSTLNWDVDPAEDPNYPTNIDADPLFVTGPLGDYYLSQTDANSASYPGQDTNSPCVDAGSDLAANLGLQNYTTRTDSVSVPDVCDVDMGYHYPLIILEVSCDFDANGVVNLADLAILLSYWLVQDCDLLAWCEGTDLDRDTDVDFVDYAIFAQCYALSESPPTDTNPPDPDPSTWEIEPNEISDFVISMTATTATDVSGLVEYLFERVSVGGEPNDVNSGWLTEREWEDTVTADETEYCYTVKTRDLYFNETLPSVERCVWIDHAAPWPDPSQWQIEPHPLSSSEIHMVATTAYDPCGVWYYFNNVTDPNHDSGWQPNSEYTDTGLAALTEYCYTVKTRDLYWNETTPSEPEECATTLP